MKSIRIIISFFLCLTLLLGLSTSIIEVSATQSSDKFNKKYTLTGNGADDMVNIALAQEGKTGSEFGYSEQWCSDFVSDCAKLAGQSEAVPFNGNQSNLRAAILKAGGTVTTSSPKAGDICFIDWTASGKEAGHVEIVYQVLNGAVYTIGGNTGSGNNLYTRYVKKHAPLPQKYISSIVRPKYSSNAPTTAPTDPFITASATIVAVNEEVTFLYNINDATTRSIGIDYAGGSRYETIPVADDSGSINYTFTQAGTYCCIIEGSNNIGYSCSHGVYVTVIDTAPINCELSVSKTTVAVGEPITFDYTILGATIKKVGIDYAGGSRYETIPVADDSGSLSYTFTQAGTYCCIIEGYNNIGLSYSSGVYVTVIDTAPINCELSVSKTTVAVGEPITFDYTILGATIKKVGIDYAGGSRYETIPVADDSGSLSYTFTQAGTYCCIIEGSNNIGYSCSHGVYVTVIDTAPINCEISANKTIVVAGETVTFDYTIMGAAVKSIGIDYAGGSRYETIPVADDSGSINYTFTQAGTYCCIIEGYNSIGYSCSHGVYVTVIDTAPINCEISANKTIVVAGETVTFDYTIMGAAVKSIGIDYAGGSRYETIPVADDSGSINYTFTQAGTYCCIIEGYNSIGYSCGHGVYVTVIDTCTEFTISFDANGGFCSTSKKSVAYGSTYGKLPIPEKEGYSFSGWFTSADGGTEITSSSMVNITANQTLYAHWSTCDHNYTVIESVDSSCTKEGSKTLKCTKCGNTYNEKIEKKAHTAVIDNAVAATCTSAGLTEGSHCSTCGTVIKARTTVPATGHTDMNNDGLCDKCSKSLAPTVYPKLSIRIPSTTTVSYGFTLNLHANVTDMPDGARVVWSMDGSGFELIPSADGMTCGVKSVSKGSATITAKVVDKNGNAVKDANGSEITASQQLTSKAGFFQKLAAFFKKLFGSNMVIPYALKKLIK